MPIEVVKFFTRDLVKTNPDKLFVFGDNDARVGDSGQAAACRGEPNAIGIRTKKYPGGLDQDYYTDEELLQNRMKISEDFINVHNALIKGQTVVVPEDGIGTGLAQLATRAPETLRYISSWGRSLFLMDELLQDLNS